MKPSLLPHFLLAILLAVTTPAWAQEGDSEEVKAQATDAILQKKDGPPATPGEMKKLQQTVQEMGYGDLEVTTFDLTYEEAVAAGKLPDTQAPETLVVKAGETEDEVYVNGTKVSRKGLALEMESTKLTHGKVSVVVDGKDMARNGVLSVIGLCDEFGVKEVTVLKFSSEF